MNNKSFRAQLATFLRGNGTRPYCDECLLEEVPGAHIADISRASANLREDSDFLFGADRACARCAQRKPLTMAAA
jgi:hypothetical protein